MLDVVEILLLLAAAGMFARVGWTDFMTLKIQNRDVLIIFGIGVAYSALFHISDLPYRTALAAFLFAVPFIFWLFKTIGAGDVKLMGSVGFIVGLNNVLLFVIGVLLVSLAMLFALRISVQLILVPSALLQRFMAILDQRRVPYGVPISVAAIAVIGKILFTETILARPV